MDSKNSPIEVPQDKRKKRAAVKKEAKKVTKQAKKIYDQTMQEAKDDKKQETAGEIIRDDKGHFVKGHAPKGGVKQGQRQKLSLAVQNAVLAVVSQEVQSDRFASGLISLRDEDPKAYYSAIAAYMKFCTPALASQSLEISDQSQVRTIDDRLDELMHQHK